MITRLRNMIRNLIKQGRLGILNDASDTQTIQAEFLKDEVVEDIERFQNYGFTSNPEGGGVLALNMGGRGNHLIAICVNDDTSRLKLNSAGDVAVYHQEGHHLLLTKDGVAHLTCKQLMINAAQSVIVDSPKTTVTGELLVEGHLTFENGMSGTGGGKGNSIDGDLTIKGQSKAQDHLSSSKSFLDHTHQTPSGESDKPS